jgi:hypothetical protein
LHPRAVKTYPMQTLDQLLSELKTTGDYFLKLDVQGAELDVLTGATEALRNSSVVLVEASLLNYNAGAPLIAEVMHYFAEHDFVLFDICELRRMKMGVLVQVDLLFIKTDSAIRTSVNFKK